ncbi:MAG: glutamate--tRNA ligase [Armatimonadetes bacterium]|nr:glutamate--tRNA ligase [Armatimonadota bacterium]
MKEVKVRFPPSPTGFVHIGNIRTALFNWLFARHSGGKFVLRIEDTDRARLVPGAEEEIFESLRWIGLVWDEGPIVGGAYGPYVQSERLEIYKRYAEELLEKGAAYYCFCTPERLEQMRREQEARKEPTGYDRTCAAFTADEVRARLEKGIPAVIRFRVPDTGQTTIQDLVRGEITFENRLLDDFVIIKSDGYPTYHFASVVDDHEMRITHVIRGEEWISSTPKHVLMYQAFGWEPPQFAHTTSILGPDRTRLSKRHGAMRFLEYREKGFLPEAMVNYMALLGWSSGEDRDLYTISELIERFSIEGIVRNPAIFDIQKLEWMNGEYIRKADLGRIADLCIPFLRQAGFFPENPTVEDGAYLREVVNLVRDRLKYLAQIVEFADFFFISELSYEEKGVEKWLRQDYVKELLCKMLPAIREIPKWTAESIEETARKVGEEMGLSGGAVIHPLRMAVTGRTAGPSLFETMRVLGRERVISRLSQTLDLLTRNRL